MTMNDNEVAIFSLRLANEFINHDQALLRTEINLKFPEYKIFIFENSEYIQATLDYELKKKRGVK